MTVPHVYWGVLSVSLPSPFNASFGNKKPLLESGESIYSKSLTIRCIISRHCWICPFTSFYTSSNTILVAIIPHKARSCYFQCERWTHRVCRCFNGGMQYNKIYETLCRMLMLLKEAPCARSFLALLKLFKNSQKPVLVWVVNYRLKKLCIVEVAL